MIWRRKPRARLVIAQIRLKVTTKLNPSSSLKEQRLALNNSLSVLKYKQFSLPIIFYRLLLAEMFLRTLSDQKW